MKKKIAFVLLTALSVLLVLTFISGCEAQYTYNVNVVIEGNGRVLNTGAYSQGSYVVLYAIPDDGYIFVGWFNHRSEQIENSKERECYISVQDSDVTVLAVFGLKED